MIKNKKEKTLTREEHEAAYREAEASVLLEGYDLSKDKFFQEIKSRVLSGEITSQEASKIILDHHIKIAAEQKK